MFKPYKTYDEIPGEVQKEVCLGNKVFKVTDVPLEDINSFYSGLDTFLETTEKRILAQQILKKLNDHEKQLDSIEDMIQRIYDKVI
tara:strand:- start:915 stop:1172 length:258 start_codon:yes stop_codon:yes gene_type:complete